MVAVVTDVVLDCSLSTTTTHLPLTNLRSHTHTQNPPFIPFFFRTSPCHTTSPPPSQVLRNDVDEVEDMRSPPEREQMSHASCTTLRDVCVCVCVCVCVLHCDR